MEKHKDTGSTANCEVSTILFLSLPQPFSGHLDSKGRKEWQCTAVQCCPAADIPAQAIWKK